MMLNAKATTATTETDDMPAGSCASASDALARRRRHAAGPGCGVGIAERPKSMFTCRLERLPQGGELRGCVLTVPTEHPSVSATPARQVDG
jgi:hypothetical protein